MDKNHLVEPPSDLMEMNAPGPNSPAALRLGLRDAEVRLQEALRRKSIADEDLTRADAQYRAASEAYVRSLEAVVGEQHLDAVLPLARGSVEDDALDVDVRYILRRLDSLFDHEKESAEKELWELGVRAVGPLLRVMQKEAERRDRWSMGVAGFSVFAIMLSMLGIAAEVSATSAPVYAFLLLVLVALVNTTRPTKMQRRAAQELAKFDDARVIGPLVEGLALDDPYTRGIAAAGLRRLLPRVRASDSGLIGKDHLQRLYRLLGQDDLNLVVAILRGLEQVGDEEAIPYVQKLAHRPAMSDAERRVRAAANECLPALRERLGREGAGGLLLRAARSPESEVESLLRPAAQSAAAVSDSLLRPLHLTDSGA